MNTRELKPLMLRFGWQNPKEVGQYLKAMGWKMTRTDLFLMRCAEWNVGIDLKNYPTAHITVHNPAEGTEGHCSFNLFLPDHEKIFAQELDFWRQCAYPEKIERIH